MVIGFDGSRAFQAERTGTENYSFQLLKALAKIDRRNKYLVYLRSDYSSSPDQIGARSSLKNINSSYGRFSTSGSQTSLRSNDNKKWPKNFHFTVINWPRFWTQGGLALQTFKDNLDVLFVPAHTMPLIRRPGLKTIITVHDLGSEYLPSMHQMKQRLYLGFMQKVQIKTATKIIAVSKATKEDLVKRIGIDPEKVVVIYEGYDKYKFKIDQSIKKYNLRYRNYFLFVGTVQPRKNLDRLIKAFNNYISNDNLIKLVIAGSKGWMSDEIYKLPKKLRIEDKVKFLGYVPDTDLPALYSGAIALTFPSLFEGFGLPILEAQACGCPVLTSNVSSMPEVAGRGAVYVNPTSTSDIVRGIGEIGEVREQIIKAGLENIKRFSWEKCATQTLEVFENLKFSHLDLIKN